MPCSHRKSGTTRRRALTCALALLGVPAAHAQQDAQTLDTIIVTSQGRTEELQKAAAPIAVFSEIQIQNAGIENTADFVRLVPNMNFDNSFTIGNSFVAMRGIQQLNNADAPVTIVVDGVPQNNQKEFKMDLFDIEQIEVLRGPQGGLYGRNAVAGAVVIKTKQPSNTPEGFAHIGIGGHGLKKLSGSSSGPLLEDRLFYRFSVAGNEYDGAIKNSYVGKAVDGYRGHDLRGQLKWLPSERQQLEWRTSSALITGSATPGAAMPTGDINTSNLWSAPISNIFGHSARRIETSSLKYRRDGDAVILTAITGYTHIAEDYYGDLDYCNPVACPDGLFGLGSQADQMQQLNVSQLSHEIRLSAPESASIQWTTGAYLLDTRRKLKTLAYFVDFDPMGVVVDSDESNRNRAWAVFGQVLFPLGDADRLELSLRLDHDRRRQTDLATYTLREKSQHAWQPKITWSHDFTNAQMWYITAGRGFRSGGFNGIGGIEFKPELLTSYEIGYKSSWLDNRLTFNSALFYQYDKDYQFFYIDLDAGGSQVISNLSRVEIMGFESELNWRVRTGWEVFASLGLLDSQIKQTGPLSTNLAITNGLRAPRTEPYNVVLGSQWSFPLGEYRAMFRFDVSRNGTRTWEADNVYKMDPVTLVNTRFTFFSNSRWNLTMWASNLFDHHYYADFTSNSFFDIGGFDVGVPAPGRRFGVDFRYDF